jgi:uncharacterized protein (DUF4213/DUF364 family)
MDVLEEIQKEICKIKDVSNLKIKRILLKSPFCVVQLNDGSIGSAVNYMNQGITQKFYDKKILEKILYSKIDCDPLLFNFLGGKKDLIFTSLKVSILSALSQDLFKKKFLNGINAIVKYPKEKKSLYLEFIPELVKNVKKILIIGDGGIYPRITEFGIKEIVVCDLKFRDKKIISDSIKRIKGFTKNNDYIGKISLISDYELKKDVSSFDMMWITGSVLCNNTFIKLVPRLKKCRRVVLQGPSCSVFPKTLFESGITDILTTIKSEGELIAGRFEDNRINMIVDRNYLYISKVII